MKIAKLVLLLPTFACACIDGVDSELVVKSGHSCQANPHTIAEVRRVLPEHRRGE